MSAILERNSSNSSRVVMF